MLVSAWTELRSVSRVISGKTSRDRRSDSTSLGFVMLSVIRILFGCMQGQVRNGACVGSVLVLVRLGVQDGAGDEAS